MGPELFLTHAFNYHIFSERRVSRGAVELDSAKTREMLGLGRLLRGVFFGPLFFLRCDVLDGRLIVFEAFLHALVGNLPDFCRVRVVDLLGGKHAPREAAGFGIDQFNP